jgi:hypothetical protein
MVRLLEEILFKYLYHFSTFVQIYCYLKRYRLDDSSSLKASLSCTFVAYTAVLGSHKELFPV